MAFSIDEFRTYASKAGFIRPSHFTMKINRLPAGLKAGSDKDTEFSNTLRDHVFAIEAANLPGVSLATDEIRRYGYGNFEKKPYVPIFADVNMRVICDAEGKMYDFFQSWMKLIINYDVREGFTSTNGVGRKRQVPYELSYKADYAVEIEIAVYDPEGRESIKVILVEAYPVFMGDINLNWGDTNSVVKLPMTFTFRDWYQERNIKNTDPTDRVALGNEPRQGSQRSVSTDLPAFRPRPSK